MGIGRVHIVAAGPGAAALSAAGLAPTWRKNGRSLAAVTARRAAGAVNESYPGQTPSSYSWERRSGVRAVWDAYGGAAFGKAVWCIGMVTLAQLEKLGVQAKVVSSHVSQDQNAQVQAV